MVLKLFGKGVVIYATDIVIVPYGIETSVPHTSVPPRRIVIVPYGIETRRFYVVKSIGDKIVIVPYGIETAFKGVLNLAVFDCNRTL